jgi:dihydropteroate synthase
MARRLLCGDVPLALDRPLVMGVLNVTPDSFSDGGRYASVDAALARARVLAAEGAAIIDVGGESTRPGAEPVPVEEELRRVLPVIEAVAALPVVVSVDTSEPEVMRQAVAAGARLINDVRGLRRPGALETVARLRVGVCVMHMQGEPGTMQLDPRYDDVRSEVRDYLAARVGVLRSLGLPLEAIAIDPGFGFGKTLEHNLALLAGLESFQGLAAAVVVGLSRKGMLGALTGRPAGERLAASIAVAALAASTGADIVRAHEVAETVDAVAVGAALRRPMAFGEMGA